MTWHLPTARDQGLRFQMNHPRDLTLRLTECRIRGESDDFAA